MNTVASLKVRMLWGTVAALGVALLLGGLIVSAPKYPTALIRVVDAAGHPVAGAVVKVEGLRTKPGPYASGWYGWGPDEKAAPNYPVKTGPDGCALVPYPKYVFEQIETGTVCLSVSHPDYVADQPERIVATAPPAGTPWLVWANYVLDRIRHKTLLARTDPVVLQQGAILQLSVRAGSAGPRETPLFAQVSGEAYEDTNFWTRPAPGVLVTRRLGGGACAIRAVRFDAQGWAWFSDVTNIHAVTGQTNEVVVDLKRGVALRGQLDAAAPRPIRHGRVIAEVWPPGSKPANYPPTWHAWATIAEDGSFELSSLPEGDLEIVALCDGFVSTNGPGKFHFHYPQKHVVGSHDLAITVGMEPTARLEVRVMDDKGQPLKDAHVTTWPNVRYGEWSAVILGADRFNTADMFLSKFKAGREFWQQPVADFEATTDSSGVAVLPNLPAEVREINVEHPRYVLQAVAGFGGQKRREATVHLAAGATAEISVQLEPRDQSPIRHY